MHSVGGGLGAEATFGGGQGWVPRYHWGAMGIMEVMNITGAMSITGDMYITGGHGHNGDHGHHGACGGHGYHRSHRHLGQWASCGP